MMMNFKATKILSDISSFVRMLGFSSEHIQVIVSTLRCRFGIVISGFSVWGLPYLM